MMVMLMVSDGSMVMMHFGCGDGKDNEIVVVWWELL